MTTMTEFGECRPLLYGGGVGVGGGGEAMIAAAQISRREREPKPQLRWIAHVTLVMAQFSMN